MKCHKNGGGGGESCFVKENVESFHFLHCSLPCLMTFCPQGFLGTLFLGNRGLLEEMEGWKESWLQSPAHDSLFHN